MSQDVKVLVINKISENYPEHTIYDEDLPENYQKPSFLVHVSSQSAVSGIGGREVNTMAFDISYYSNANEGNNQDCYLVGAKLLQEFQLTQGFRLKNKKAETIENVLHFTFEVKYVLKEEVSIPKMQQKKTKISL